MNISRALEPGSDMPAPRRAALLREALVHCGRLEALLTDRTLAAAPSGRPLDPAGLGDTASRAAPATPAPPPSVPRPMIAPGAGGVVIAGRRAPRGPANGVTVLTLRPRASVDAAPDMHHVRAIAEQQLRSTGDHSRLLDPGQVLSITLECDRPGGLAVLRRITRALGARGVPLGDLEYALTELEAGDGGDALHRAGGGYAVLSFEPERTTPPRVLVVDDNPTVLELIVEHIQACHPEVEIESTTSAYDACVRFGEFEPDLVMLDIRMPEIDGRDAISTMQKARNGRDVKFIAASATPEHFPEMLRRGCTACLQKPFDLDELAALVASALGDGEALRQAA